MADEMRIYLQPTPMLDFQHGRIQQLIKEKGWRRLPAHAAIGAAYDFVRDEMAFGYNRDDNLSASQVLKDGYGQCNTKGTLLMALLRAMGVPARFHGFTIDNELQRGAIPNYLMPLAPKRIIHSWVEVYHQGEWLELEGYILDKTYLTRIQNKFADSDGKFCAYGIATNSLKNPQIAWKGGNTYIQKEGIADDFGLYKQPDDFYREKGSNLRGAKKYFYRYLVRHLMNRNVKRIRMKGV